VRLAVATAKLGKVLEAQAFASEGDPQHVDFLHVQAFESGIDAVVQLLSGDPAAQSGRHVPPGGGVPTQV
jgi:hypothetical protein